MNSGHIFTSNEAAIRADAAEALANLNCDSSLARVQRTRRAVRDAALSLEEQRNRRAQKHRVRLGNVAFHIDPHGSGDLEQRRRCFGRANICSIFLSRSRFFS